MPQLQEDEWPKDGQLTTTEAEQHLEEDEPPEPTQPKPPRPEHPPAPPPEEPVPPTRR